MLRVITKKGLMYNFLEMDWSFKIWKNINLEAAWKKCVLIRTRMPCLKLLTFFFKKGNKLGRVWIYSLTYNVLFKHVIIMSVEQWQTEDSVYQGSLPRPTLSFRTLHRNLTYFFSFFWNCTFSTINTKSLWKLTPQPQVWNLISLYIPTTPLS